MTIVAALASEDPPLEVAESRMELCPTTGMLSKKLHVLLLSTMTLLADHLILLHCLQ